MTATATSNPSQGQAAPPGRAARARRRRRIGPFADRQRYQRDIAVAAADLGAAINTDQGVFAGNATAGADAFTGLEAGVIVLALLMAIGCAWGLSRRLAEYR
ncbi:MAG TPA: hypothetical protein VME19_22130 [Streptosporangiaceae bacterium]|nr:hypothetical protein [Streptosporangiaceae bacterium]